VTQVPEFQLLVSNSPENYEKVWILSLSNGPSSEDMLLFTGGTFKKPSKFKGVCSGIRDDSQRFASIEIAPLI